MTVVKMVSVLSSSAVITSDEIPSLKEIERLSIDSSENRYINTPINRRAINIPAERYFDLPTLFFLFFAIDYTAYEIIRVAVGMESNQFLE